MMQRRHETHAPNPDVGGEDMDEGEEAEVEKEIAEAEEGGLGGICWH